MKLTKQLLWLTASTLFAQGTTPDMLLKPPKDSWPAYHGDYSGKRHSALTQITPQNVGGLALAWAYQTGANAQIKASPLMVDGVIYFSTPDNVYAVDARSGHQIWHYTYPQNQTLPHRLPRRLHVRRMAVLHDAGRPPDLPEREGGRRPLERRRGRFPARLLD